VSAPGATAGPTRRPRATKRRKPATDTSAAGAWRSRGRGRGLRSAPTSSWPTWDESTATRWYIRETDRLSAAVLSCGGGTTTQRGYGAEWRRRRAQQLRAHPVCERVERGPRCRRPSTDVDHIVPKVNCSERRAHEPAVVGRFASSAQDQPSRPGPGPSGNGGQAHDCRSVSSRTGSRCARTTILRVTIGRVQGAGWLAIVASDGAGVGRRAGRRGLLCTGGPDAPEAATTMGIMKLFAPRAVASYRAGEHFGNRISLRGWSEVTPDMAAAMEWDEMSSAIGVQCPAELTCAGDSTAVGTSRRVRHPVRTHVFRPAAGEPGAIEVRCPDVSCSGWGHWRPRS
jgi:hypothetical protein